LVLFICCINYRLGERENKEMDKEYLIQQLDNIENAMLVNRMKVVHIVLENKELFDHLLKIAFEINNKTSIKAAWILELVCNKKLDLLAPHLTYFTENISKVQFESAIRAISKICQFLAKAYTSTQKSKIQAAIKTAHIEKMIEAGFDWLISDQKVAVKAYSMEQLYLFGKNIDWVHEELQLIIEQNIIRESCGYKARGKKILSWINKK
jgi:hypothetical protein